MAFNCVSEGNRQGPRARTYPPTPPTLPLPPPLPPPPPLPSPPIPPEPCVPSPRREVDTPEAPLLLPCHYWSSPPGTDPQQYLTWNSFYSKHRFRYQTSWAPPDPFRVPKSSSSVSPFQPPLTTIVNTSFPSTHGSFIELVNGVSCCPPQITLRISFLPDIFDHEVNMTHPPRKTVSMKLQYGEIPLLFSFFSIVPWSPSVR